MRKKEIKIKKKLEELRIEKKDMDKSLGLLGDCKEELVNQRKIVDRRDLLQNQKRNRMAHPV